MKGLERVSLFDSSNSHLDPSDVATSDEEDDDEDRGERAKLGGRVVLCRSFW